MSDEEHPSEASADSSTAFNPPTEPGAPTSASGGPAKNRSNTVAIGIAVVVVLAIAVGAYFLVFAKDNGPFAFSGEIALPAACSSTTGLSAKMLASNGSVIAQGPFSQHGTSSTCTLTFAYQLPKADKYQFALGLPAQIQAQAGVASLPGPTYTLEELQNTDFHIKLSPSDFTPPSPAPTPVPAPGGAPTITPPKPPATTVSPGSAKSP